MIFQIEGFVVGRILGRGSYGTVVEVRCARTKKRKAAKIFANGVNGVPQDAIREIGLMRTLDHPSILRCNTHAAQRISLWCRVEETVVSPRGVAAILEHMCGNLEQRMMKPYSEVDIKVAVSTARKSTNGDQRWMYQLLAAVHHAHSHRIMHRDIKRENILVDHADNIKLADFGIATTFQSPLSRASHAVCTLGYRPLEILLAGGEHGRCHLYSPAIDLWSVGCVFAELYSGKPLFSSSNHEFDHIIEIFMLRGTPSDKTWPGVSALPDYSPLFPNMPPKDLSQEFPNMGPDAIELLEVRGRVMRREPDNDRAFSH